MKYYRLLLLGMCISASDQAGTSLSINLHRAFWADYNQFNRKYTTAYSWYQKMLDAPHKPNYMYKGLLHLFAQTKQYPRILALINTLDESFQHDVDVQLLFAQALQFAGNQKAAEQKILKLSSIVKDNQQVALNAAQIFFRAKEPENALLTIQDYIASQEGDPHNFIFHFLAGQIYLSLNKKELALKQVSACLALQPHFDKAWLMLALLHEQLNNIPKALDAYQMYMQITKETAPHVKQRMLALTNSPVTTIEALFTQGDYTTALELLNNHLHKQPQDARALFLKIKTLNALQLSEQAIDLALSLVEANPYDHLWFDTLHALKNNAQTQTIIATLQRLQTVHADSPYITLYLGTFCGKACNVIDAFAHYDTVFKQTTDNNIKALTLSHWASLLREYKLYQFMPNLIEQATSFKHELPALHNIVAYWYATKGNKHTQSLAILKKILPQEPGNADIVDTVGRLFYKQKQFDIAGIIFRSGLHLNSHHPRIARHLAKSYTKQWEQYSLYNTVLELLSGKIANLA